MKQKGIVLLITLFFISAISVLILKNLDDSEKFMDEISYDMQLIQLKITHENVQKEIVKFVNNNKKSIEQGTLESLTFPLTFVNIDLIINIDFLEQNRCNINELKKIEDIFDKCGEDIAYNILDPNTFISNLKDINKDQIITSQKQLDYFINEYEKSVNDDQINLIRKNFSYFNTDDSTYIKCRYSVSVKKGIEASAYFIFKLGSATIVNNYFVLK